MASSNWSKPKNDNSPENIENFKLKLETSRKYVEELLKGKTYGEPEIVSGLDSLRQETAERIYNLYKTDGIIIRNKMEVNDVNRVREIQKKNNISFEEAIQTLVKNCKYMSIERQFAENYVLIIRDVERVLKTYGDKLKVFPMNALSKEAIAKFDSNQVGLSNTIKLKMILDAFVPGFMNLNIVTNDYSVVAKKYFELSELDLAVLANDIKKNFGDEDGKIDKIFAKENRAGLVKLIESLKRNHLSFEEFAARFNIDYTRCYNIPSLIAGKQMVSEYYKKYKTYRFIKNNDQYLATKLSGIRKQENFVSNKRLFDSWGLDTSEMIEPNNMVTDFEVLKMQKELIAKLEMICTNKTIPNNFSREHKDIYFYVSKLAKKFGYNDVDSYFASIGYHREVDSRRNTYKNTLCLSERDLVYYRFFAEATSDEDVKKIMQEMNISLASVEDYYGFYTKLAFEKCDAYYHTGGNFEAKKKDED